MGTATLPDRPTQTHTVMNASGGKMAQLPAGGYSRVSASGVGALLSDPATRPGPSNEKFSKWKRAGQPTSQLEQQTVHGRSSARNESTKDIIYDPTVFVPPSRPAHSTRLTVNPITWEGGSDLKSNPTKEYTEPILGTNQMKAPKPSCSEPSYPKENIRQMLQNGHASAATCLMEYTPRVDTPPLAHGVASIPTLGLEPNHAGCNARHQRNGKFSSQFGDPYDNL